MADVSADHPPAGFPAPGAATPLLHHGHRGDCGHHQAPGPRTPAGVGRTVPGPQAAPADTPPARPPPAADAAGLESVTYEKHLFSRTSRRSPAGPKARPHKRPRAPARPATQ
ncbi:hypothetical protein SAV31267_085540 [Streptomyces avermitilis]|uniref:Uncharacterized protein n=1 Tax=Streptomyces avermitilis TaxID=33903 RepID=A0A4D4N6C7_STRAX|nr:hypothetical protein SAV31267_085540 [Streptomyces avermitilis]